MFGPGTSPVRRGFGGAVLAVISAGALTLGPTPVAAADRTTVAPPTGAGQAVAAAAPGLYAGGTFTRAGGTAVDRVARWTGTVWSGPGGAPAAGPDGPVTAFTLYQGDLVVGGSFLTAGGVRVNGIARWDGSTWTPLTGPAGTGVMSTPLDFVDALAVFDGDLIVGGQFLQAGGVAVNHVARWDGTRWYPLTGAGGTGVDVAPVSDLAVHDGVLIVAGGFSQAGGLAANRIARWTGQGWSTLGAGFNGEVLALAVFSGALVATGGFTEVDGVPAARIARWDGDTWAALGGGLNAEGRALTVHDGSLVVGGHFTEAGGATVNYLARWSGTAWAGLTGPGGTGTDDTVLCLAVHDGRLVAGGFFATAGGVAVAHVAAWNGASWAALAGPAGAGTDGGVYALHSV
ncbi:hypothetical protein [Plantactinospora sonchi]|uniref:Cortical protein marker for cell polarity n=1 Tax=Plantactinospora sonchi TaxID=1544735 RepID=A0ABU7S4Y6_9ACTN